MQHFKRLRAVLRHGDIGCAEFREHRLQHHAVHLLVVGDENALGGIRRVGSAARGLVVRGGGLVRAFDDFRFRQEYGESRAFAESGFDNRLFAHRED